MPRHPDATEVIQKRTRASKHFANPDGSFIAEFIGGSGKHYWNPTANAWRDRVLTLRDEGGRYISDENDVRVEIYQEGTGGSARWYFQITGLASGKGFRFRLGSAPSISDGTATYTAPDGVWTYQITAGGAKLLGPPVASSVGSRTIEFAYEAVGAPAALSVQPDGSLTNGEVTFRRPALLGADGFLYTASAWSLPGAGRMGFSFSDATLGAGAYPYRIDPTSSYPIGANTDNQHVQRQSADYATLATGNFFRNANSTSNIRLGGRSFNSGASLFEVQDGLLAYNTSGWNTSRVITAIRQQCTLHFRDVRESRVLQAEWYAWDGVSQSDWSLTSTASAMASYDPAPLTNTAGTIFTMPLDNSTGFNPNGYTRLRFHMSGGQPTNWNYVAVYPLGNTSFTPPTLLVDYTETTTETLRPDAILEQTNDTKTLANLQRDVP